MKNNIPNFTSPFSLLTVLTLFSLIFLLSACSSPTSTPKGSLSGTINLECLSDHLGIIVAIYDLAELDPDIVYYLKMNNVKCKM
ncbi:MAG: hypothetical protein K8S16_18050 [Bacteroidales bacterium]|nr:hypothetical protein [Bacteroidales bacterium]